MAGFNFSSGPAEISNVLTQILSERKAAQRQAMLDSIMQQDQQSKIEDRSMNRKIQQSQLDSLDEQRKQAAENQKNELAIKVATTLPEGVAVSPETESALGPLAGSMLQSQGGIVPGGEGPTETRVFSGTQHGQEVKEQTASREQIAREATAAKEETARIAAEERASRATEANETRKTIAESSQQNARVIAGMVQSGKQDAAATKTAAAETEKGVKRQAQISQAQDTLKAISGLRDPSDPTKLSPEMQSIVGAWGGKLPEAFTPPGGDIANARARLKEVQSRLVTGLLGELKSQSRTGATGFGALSGPELAIIESASGRLSSAQDPKQFTEALNEIEERVGRILQEPKPTAAAAGPAAVSAPTATPAPGDTSTVQGTGLPPIDKWTRNPATGRLEKVK